MAKLKTRAELRFILNGRDVALTDVASDQTLLDWLRHARIAINLPPQDSGYLSDAHLRDIGLRRTDIARSVSDAPQRLGLLDLGWQPPRSNKHR